MPGDLKPKDIKWLSVWCRQFKVNFGDVFFPDDMESKLEDIYEDIFEAELVKVGNLKNYAHGISGEVFVKDEKTLIIKGKVCKIVNKPSVESAIYYSLYFYCEVWCCTTGVTKTLAEEVQTVFCVF